MRNGPLMAQAAQGSEPGDDDVIGTPKRSSPIELCGCHSCGSAVTENVDMAAVGVVQANSLIQVLA
jgi:hypothetical protein